MKNFIFIVVLFFFSACSIKTTNPEILEAKNNKIIAMEYFKNEKDKKAIKYLKKAFKIYAKYDDIDNEVKTLLLLAKIDNKNSIKYLRLANSFFNYVDDKLKEEIKFTNALINKNKKEMIKLSKIATSNKIKALAKIYIFKWSKNPKYLKNFRYNKKDYIYSFYLYEKSFLMDLKNRAMLLKKALEIDKSLQIKRFIKRDLKALYNTYKQIDNKKALIYKIRLELIDD